MGVQSVSLHGIDTESSLDTGGNSETPSMISFFQGICYIILFLSSTVSRSRKQKFSVIQTQVDCQDVRQKGRHTTANTVYLLIVSLVCVPPFFVIGVQDWK